VIFVDSNIPMYLVGAPHPRKTETQILLERATASKERLVTDAEVLQEILHRYTLIERRGAIQTAFEAILEVVDDILPVEKRDVLRAGEIVQLPGDWSARDAFTSPSWSAMESAAS
jgi:predicted nucleic acid-binding protein